MKRTGNLKKSILTLAAAGMVAAAALLGSVSPAAAAGELQEPAPPSNERLTLLYERLQLVLEGQALRLEYAGKAADHGQKWIDLLNSQGVEDVDELEELLAEYRAGIADASESYTAAADILAEHAGFDDEGNVTDPEQAAQTLREAGQNLRESHRTLREATRDFRMGIRDWRMEHRPPRPPRPNEGSQG
jgi:hypothetical protein